MGWGGVVGGIFGWGGVFTRGLLEGEGMGMSMTSRGYSGWVGDKQGGVGVIY